MQVGLVFRNASHKGSAVAGALVAAAVVIVAVVAARASAPAVAPQDLADLNASAAAAASTAPTTAPAQNSTAEVMPRLDDPRRPFTVLVFSDSTGAFRNGWVARLGAMLGSHYDRPVTANTWDGKSNPPMYSEVVWHLRDSGAGAPIIFWNAAYPSTDAVYALENIDAMAPMQAESVDLVFVSHGHNHDVGELLPEGSRLMAAAAKQFSNAAIVDILQNPERQSAPHARTQEAGVERLAWWARTNNFPTIDVHGAFLARPDWENLMDDSLYHPTDEGYQLWADTVMTQLIDPVSA